MKKMIYIDTHIAVWLYQKNLDLFAAHVKDFLDTHDILISPMVSLELSFLHEIGKIKDSKRLTAAQRSSWFSYLCNSPDVQFAIGRAYPATIDKINITRAANLAAYRAFSRLMRCRRAAVGATKMTNETIRMKHGMKQTITKKRHPAINKKSNKYKIFLDGGLYLRDKASSNELGAKTIIKGDEKIRAVALASIVAKVHRDRHMVRLSQKYPGYGFERHKGYGTRLHYRKIRAMGPSPAHRLTFLA